MIKSSFKFGLPLLAVCGSLLFSGCWIFESVSDDGVNNKDQTDSKTEEERAALEGKPVGAIASSVEATVPVSDMTVDENGTVTAATFKDSEMGEVTVGKDTITLNGEEFDPNLFQ